MNTRRDIPASPLVLAACALSCLAVALMAPGWALAGGCGAFGFASLVVLDLWHRRRPRRSWICSECLGDCIFNRKPIWATQAWCHLRRHYRRPLLDVDALARRDAA